MLAIMEELTCRQVRAKPVLHVMRDDSGAAIKGPFLSRLVEDRIIIDAAANVHQPSYASWVSLLREKLPTTK